MGSSLLAGMALLCSAGAAAQATPGEEAADAVAAQLLLQHVGSDRECAYLHRHRTVLVFGKLQHFLNGFSLFYILTELVEWQFLWVSKWLPS